MAIVKLTDDFGLDVDANVNDDSSLVKYLKNLTHLKFDKFDAKEIFNQQLDKVAVNQLKIGVNFDRDIPVGTNRADLTANATAGMTIDVIPPSAQTLMDDVFGAPIAIADGEYYVGITLSATVSADLTATQREISFGFSPSTQAAFTTYRRFIAPYPTLENAIKTALDEFTIPADIHDLGNITPDIVVAASGSGSLQGSISTNLPTVANPLASADLPIVGTVALQQGASISVEASITVTADYQVRARTDRGQLQIGFYHSKAKSFDLAASLDADVSGDIGSTDLLTKALQAISPDASLDADALKAAGLSDDQISAMQDAVSAAIQRKIALSLSFTLGNSRQDEAAFLYTINLAGLNDTSSQAVHLALDGDLSRLSRSGNALQGITLVRSILIDTRETEHGLVLNLLGIYSIGTVKSLVVQGKMLYEPESGDLILTDTATAKAVSSAISNFVADTEKIRRLLFMSVIATASYRCSGVIAAPNLSLTNTFYSERTKTSRQDLKDALGIPQALGLITADDQISLLDTARSIGRTHVSATASYDSALLDRLFFNGGQPRPVAEYENAARFAFARMIQADDFDHDRRTPMLDDNLWKAFTTAVNLAQIHSSLKSRFSEQIINDMQVDLITIEWWAKALQNCAIAIKNVRDFVSSNPTATPEDNRFRTLRRALASTLATVAADTSAGFGEPWGLLAMDAATDHVAPTTVLITGPGLSVVKSRPIVATAANAD